MNEKNEMYILNSVEEVYVAVCFGFVSCFFFLGGHF